MNSNFFIFLSLLAAITVTSCGVYGPPLPPETEQNSDNTDAIASINPSPSTTPSPAPKAELRRTTKKSR